MNKVLSILKNNKVRVTLVTIGIAAMAALIVSKTPAVEVLVEDTFED